MEEKRFLLRLTVANRCWSSAFLLFLDIRAPRSVGTDVSSSSSVNVSFMPSFRAFFHVDWLSILACDQKSTRMPWKYGGMRSRMTRQKQNQIRTENTQRAHHTSVSSLTGAEDPLKSPWDVGEGVSPVGLRPFPYSSPSPCSSSKEFYKCKFFHSFFLTIKESHLS